MNKTVPKDKVLEHKKKKSGKGTIICNLGLYYSSLEKYFLKFLATCLMLQYSLWWIVLNLIKFAFEEVTWDGNNIYFW